MDTPPIVEDLQQELQQLFETVTHKTANKSCCGLVHILFCTKEDTTLSLKYQQGQIVIDLFHVKDEIKLQRATFYQNTNKLFEFLNLYLQQN